ncbi:hypothetical protein J6590_084906 [Homalodisca vitripennis]|nr:hypothetical protein J6590_099145 [Homalodisca vitripennis]KAG8304964.1 hypothetical protein J6590_081261 [Homalodisca vitripennis]KAG8334679.1 hypothetical protein J6590_084906 [Homalodisca vitripennis]
MNPDERILGEGRARSGDSGDLAGHAMQYALFYPTKKVFAKNIPNIIVVMC